MRMPLLLYNGIYCCLGKEAPKVRQNTDGGVNPRSYAIHNIKALEGRQNIRNLSTLSGFLLPLALVTGGSPPSVVCRLFETLASPTYCVNTGNADG